MQFELSSALIDEILFSMEDQEGRFLLDTNKAIVIKTDEDTCICNNDEGSDRRFISLPEWGPQDGFRLMERFTAGIHSALVREELSAALNRGRGVFRAFKNTLAQYPETEKLWYGYKDREMKQAVLSWYNGLRESWGIELIGEEPEDTAGLVLEDFRFRKAAAADLVPVKELHNSCLAEYGDKIGNSINPAGNAGINTIEILSGLTELVFPCDMSFIAETASGEFSGYISATRVTVDILRINAIEIKPEYRGLGLGKTLVSRLLEQADSEKIPNIIIDLPAGHDHFCRALLRENFKPCVERYYRNTKELLT